MGPKISTVSTKYYDEPNIILGIVGMRLGSSGLGVYSIIITETSIKDDRLIECFVIVHGIGAAVIEIIMAEDDIAWIFGLEQAFTHNPQDQAYSSIHSLIMRIQKNWPN